MNVNTLTPILLPVCFIHQCSSSAEILNWTWICPHYSIRDNSRFLVSLFAPLLAAPKTRIHWVSKHAIALHLVGGIRLIFEDQKCDWAWNIIYGLLWLVPTVVLMARLRWLGEMKCLRIWGEYYTMWRIRVDNTLLISVCLPWRNIY